MATKDELQNSRKVTEERKAQTKEIREQVRLQDKEQTLVSKLNDSLKKQRDLRFSNNKAEKDLSTAAAKHLKFIQEKGKKGDSLTKSYKDQFDLNNKIRGGSLKQGQLSKVITEAAQKEAEARKKGNVNVADGYKGLVKMAEGQKKFNATKMFEANISKSLDKMTGGMASKAKDFADNVREAPMGALKAGAAGLAVTIGVTLIKAITAFSAKIDAVGETFGFITNKNKEFRNDLIAAGNEAAAIGKGLGDVLAVTSQLSSEFGITLTEADDLSTKVLDTAVATGLSNDEATKLFGSFMQIGDLTAKQAEDLIEGTAQLAAQRGVAPTAVLQDMAGSAEEIAKFTSGSGENIAEAAIQARQLGLSLQTTAKISEGLLDFESSIQAEIEASVMTGRRLNFQKARQLSLDGDLAGATKEVVKQLGSEEELNKLNVLQRQSIAKSIGVSASELTKLVRGQDKLTLSTALAGKKFDDLVGQDSLSALSSIINNLKVVGGMILDEIGKPMSDMLMKFKESVMTPKGMKDFKSNIIGFLNGMSGFLNTLLVAADVMTLGLSRLAIDGGISSLRLGKIDEVDDFRGGRGAITTMAGPAGVFRLNPMDSVMATTNPIPVNDFSSGPAGSMGGTQKIEVTGQLTGTRGALMATIESPLG